MIWGGADVIVIEIKYAINGMHLNHFETIPSLLPVRGKIVFMKLVPGVKKVGNHCPRPLITRSLICYWIKSPPQFSFRGFLLRDAIIFRVFRVRVSAIFSNLEPLIIPLKYFCLHVYDTICEFLTNYFITYCWKTEALY